MRSRAFFDTNVLLYLLSADAGKAGTAERLLAAGGHVSVAARYRLHIYDAMIVAAALLAGCERLYSEDLQAGQRFDKRLRIVNPF